MRPEISALLAPIYPKLQNHEIVTKYPKVRGMLKNFFFVDHNEKESTKPGEADRSKVNQYEVSYVIPLLRYLRTQGYESKQITVLTFYLGQRFRLVDAIKAENKALGDIRVATVDNFQGEENDIIVLSIVRCNTEGIIGYCGVDNRICVALSRARQGFYLIGSQATLRSAIMRGKGKLWGDILPLFGPAHLGPTLELHCENHPDFIRPISKTDDFKGIKDGGCDLRCEARLPCGHACPRYCHPDGHDFPCQQRCAKTLACGHPCKSTCSKACPSCRELVEKVIPTCQHTRMVPCSIPAEKFQCTMPCAKVMECGHPCTLTCGESCGACKEMVTKLLPCGHETKALCSTPLEKIQCKRKCPVLLPCGHPCPGDCSACRLVHAECKKDCKRVLVCSHLCRKPCIRECPSCEEKCTNFCVHSKCQNKCGEPCPPCQEKCGWRCVHLECTKKCHEACDRPRCDVPCPRLLKCKHPCLGLCGERCPNLCRVCTPDHEAFSVLLGEEDNPEAKFIQLECDHIFEVGGLDRWMDATDDQQAGIQFKSCIKCKRPIRKIQRYNNLTKRVMADVNAVKLRVVEAQVNGDQLMAGNKAKIRAAGVQIRPSSLDLGVSLGQLLRLLEGTTNSTVIEHINEKVAVLNLLNPLRSACKTLLLQHSCSFAGQ